MAPDKPPLIDSGGVERAGPGWGQGRRFLEACPSCRGTDGRSKEMVVRIWQFAVGTLPPNYYTG